MPTHIKAELWDKMHYLFRNYNDRMMHFELTYGSEIDEKTVKIVLASLLNKMPVLHSSFIDKKLYT